MGLVNFQSAKQFVFNRRYNLLLTLIFLFLLNFSIPFSLINDGLFHQDSLALASQTEMVYKHHQLYFAANGRPGLVIMNSIIYFPFYIFGMNADFSTRLSGVLFHALSIAALFLFINEFTCSQIMAFFTSLLFSFSPLYISSNTYGKEHGMAIFFLSLSLYTLLLSIKKNKPLLLSLSSILFVFSIGVRESNIALTPFFFLLYLKPKLTFYNVSLREGALKIKDLFCLIFPFIALLAIWLKLFLYGIIKANLFVYTGGSGGIFAGFFSPMLSKAIADLTNSMTWLLFLFMLFGIAVSFGRSLKNREDMFVYAFFLLWSLLIFYFGNTNGYKARYLDLVLIPIHFFVAYFLCIIYKKYKLLSFIFLLYFIMSMFLFIYPILKFRHDYSGPKEFALWLQSTIESDAYIMSVDDTPAISYYTNHSKYYDFPLHYRNNASALNEWMLNLSRFLAEGNKVYVISSAFIYDPQNIILQSFLNNFDLILAGEKLTEDYHNADIKYMLHNQNIFRLLNKAK